MTPSTPPQHWAPLKRDVLDSLADEFLHNYSRGRTVIAIDGIDGSGATEFADALAARVGRNGHGVFRASIDDFHRPRPERQARGDDSPDGRYRHAYDYDLFRRVLVEPFKLGGSTGFVTAAWDTQRDIPVEMEWKTGPKDATLVVDGLFLNRPELRGIWNWSIWLEVPRAVAATRAIDRVQHTPAAQDLYWAEASPRTRANAIVDNTDVEHPRRIFADSC